MTHKDERVPNWTYYRAGLSCEIAGDRAAALEFYRRMRDVGDADRVWDTRMYRRVQRLLQRPMTEGEKLIIQGENAFSQKEFAESIRLLSLGLEKTAGDPDLEGRALYGIVQAEYEKNNLVTALQTAQRLVVLKPSSELWVVPHGWFKIGQIHFKQGNPFEARAAFQQVLKYDDYDFQTRLETNVKEEMQELDAAK